MARDKGLDKGLIRYFDDSRRDVRGQKENFFGFRKLFTDYLAKLNVAFYDVCCPLLTDENIFPTRYDADANAMQYFNGTAWVDAVIDEIGGDTLEIGATTISDDGGIVNSNMLVGFYPQAAQQNITAGTGGAINVTSYFTTINTDAGGDAFTLADGTVVGQRKRIRLVVDGGGDGVVTPANFVDTTITFNDAGDDVELMWDGTQWFTLANVGATIA